MKAGLLSIAALSAVAIAQPQHGAHRHRHAKKQAVEYVTDVSYVTAAAQDLVYVDQNGNPVSTGAAQATQAPAPPSYDDKPQENQQSQAPAPAPTSYAAPSPSQAQQSSAPAPSSYSSGSDSSDSKDTGYGISYSPYNADGSCKTSDQIKMDLDQIEGYGMIRMYGTDCDQAGPIIDAAKSKGMKVMAGIYDIKNVQQEAETLSKAVNGDWSAVDTVSVGNEGINSGTYSISDVKSAVETARGCLKESGYSGSVITVDTFVAIINNPGLCDVGDYVGANCHAFFDGNVAAEDSGAFVLEQAQRVSAACGGKHTVITEAGWPSKGASNGKAIPSSENQKAAVKSLKDSFSSDIYMFTAYNGYWKSGAEIEKYWGIYGDCPSES